ncbi:MAG: type II secretion system F family protein, partial [Proteobacteria bacterium]|nr:type II secretion system F family protein [Pseudomonadota bacterium]
EQLKARMLQAGYKHKHAHEIFNGVRVTLGLCLPLFVAPFAARMSMTVLAVIVVVTAGIGYYLPKLIVDSRIEKRRKALLESFPDALDLLVASVEAGLGIDAAFRRVANEITPVSPLLGREFQMVNHEISAGIARIDALRHLQERTGVEEVRTLVNMLQQAERFGTSIAKSLRIHSKITRQKRMSRAEEEAAKVSPKLTVVMILFMLPCLMVVLLGPAVLRVLKVVSEN